MAWWNPLTWRPRGTAEEAKGSEFIRKKFAGEGRLAYNIQVNASGKIARIDPAKSSRRALPGCRLKTYYLSPEEADQLGRDLSGG